MMGERYLLSVPTGEGRGDRLAVLTTIFYVRVYRTDHLPPPRKISTRTWLPMTYASFAGEKEHASFGGGGVKESNSHNPQPS